MTIEPMIELIICHSWILSMKVDSIRGDVASPSKFDFQQKLLTFFLETLLKRISVAKYCREIT